MLLKAFTTHDLRSYSLTHIALSNVGNLIHWVYVASLPVGPIWFLHGFFTDYDCADAAVLSALSASCPLCLS